MDEIANGKKGKVAFVIGWFNSVDSFSQRIQLGTGNWAYPLADEQKRRYFPFLEASKVPVYTKDLKYNYKKAYLESPLDLISSQYKGIYKSMFIGEENDKFILHCIIKDIKFGVVYCTYYFSG